MQEDVGHTRLVLTRGTTYAVVETVDEVHEALKEASRSGMLFELTSVTGQSAFPPERLFVRADHVATIQEISFESWIWQQRASELHYARQIEEMPAMERHAAAAERLAAALEGGDHE